MDFSKERNITITQDVIESALICCQNMRSELLSIYEQHRTPDWEENLKDTEVAIDFFKSLSIL